MMIQAKGCNVHAELEGEGNQKVVLLHGWGCSADLMKPIADGLSDSMKTLTIDFPGFGASDRPPEPWGVPEYAEMLRDLLTQLDFSPCDVIAHSFGARVAIFLASSDHSMIRRQVLTGAAGIRPVQSEESRKRTQNYKKMKSGIALLKKTHLLGSLPERMEDALRKKYGSRDYNALDEEMRKTFVKVISLDLSDRLSAVEAPTLLIWGDQDTETPLWMGQKMEQEIPDAGLVVFEGGSHFVYLEQQKRFLTVVRHFLLEE